MAKKNAFVKTMVIRNEETFVRLTKLKAHLVFKEGKSISAEQLLRLMIDDCSKAWRVKI